MSDSPKSLFGSFGSHNAPIIRVVLLYGSKSSHVFTNQYSHEVIHITDDSDSKRLSRGSLDEGVFSNDFYFDALISNDDAKDDRVIILYPLHPKL